MLMMAGGLGIVRRGKRTEKRQPVRSGVFVDDDDYCSSLPASLGAVREIEKHCKRSAQGLDYQYPSGTGVTVLT